MKLRIDFKDPDLIHEYLCNEVPFPEDEDEITLAMEKKRDTLCNKLFEFGDYGCVELDTEKGTFRFVPRKEWL